MAELPPELRTLTARETEDVLCIYNDQFSDRGSSARKHWAARSASSCSDTLPCQPFRSSDCG